MFFAKKIIYFNSINKVDITTLLQYLPTYFRSMCFRVPIQDTIKKHLRNKIEKYFKYFCCTRGWLFLILLEVFTFYTFTLF